MGMPKLKKCVLMGGLKNVKSVKMENAGKFESVKGLQEVVEEERKKKEEEEKKKREKEEKREREKERKEKEMEDRRRREEEAPFVHRLLFIRRFCPQNIQRSSSRHGYGSFPPSRLFCVGHQAAEDVGSDSVRC